ncbi:MAG: DUF11 domain-containing protein [Anaerolineae bacterium]|nr:DUF11 domain-containing protein [Anaerolineae bacterium]
MAVSAAVSAQRLRAPTAAPTIDLRRVLPAITRPDPAVPGQTVLYSANIRNLGGAANGVLTITLPTQMNMGTVAFTPGGTVVSNTVIWNFTNFANTSYENYTVTVTLPDPSVAHDQLSAQFKSQFTNPDGTDTDGPILINNHYVIPPTIEQTLETSIVQIPNNTEDQAVAGEFVTATVAFSIPDGLVAYSVLPRIALEDGLSPIAARSDPWESMVQNTRTNLDNVIPSAIPYASLITFADHDAITGPTWLTYTVVALRTQNYFINPSAEEIKDEDALGIEPILRWSDTFGEVVNANDTLEYVVYDSSSAIDAIRPHVESQLTYTYLDAGGVGAGGGEVEVVIANTNTGTAIAYDGIVTATAYLSYTGSSPAPDSLITVGDLTTLTWELPTIDPGASWPVIVNVEFPPTFTIGTQFLAIETQTYQETFAGDVPDEGKYIGDIESLTLSPGIAHTKYANLPSETQIQMGDIITYTVIFTQGANTVLQEPYYVDLLPLGFHLANTVTVQGGAVVTGIIVGDDPAASGFIREQLSWYMESLSTLGENYQAIEAIYQINNTGLDNNEQYVYATVNDMTRDRPADNSAQLYWRPPDGSPFSSLPAVQAQLNIIQPFFSDGNLLTQRVDSGDEEVGQFAQFKFSFRNSGRTSAYEVEICDQLPEGLVLDTANGFSYVPTDLEPLVEPQQGDNLLCWTLDEVPIGSTYEIGYYAKVLNTAMAGVPLVNNVYIKEYTSLPGDSPLERHYGDIIAAIPPVNHCADPEVGCLVVLGLAVDKIPGQLSVGAGELLTYTITYTDTSSGHDPFSQDYTNVIITDVIDTDLNTFVEADPEPDVTDAGLLAWNVGNLADTGGEILLTMQVKPLIPDNVFELANTLSWQSDEIPYHEISRTVELATANVNVAISSNPTHVHADSSLAYTVLYSNTGSAASSLVTLTLGYDPHLDFVSAPTIAPVTGTTNVFTDIIAADGQNHSMVINMRVKTPLPYDYDGPLHTSVSIESRGATSKSDSVDVILDRPILELQKTGPTVASAEGYPMKYSIVVRNVGTYAATNVAITDTWGLNLEYDSSNSSFHWIKDGGYATQTLGTLNIGATVNLDFQVIISDTATSYTNTVTLTSDQTTLQTEIERTWQASIATSKSATPVPAFPGRVLTYTIYYTNTTPSAGAMVNARITDTLPVGFVYQGNQTYGTGCVGGWGFSQPSGTSGGNAVWSCGTLMNNVSGYFQIWGEVLTTTEDTNLENYVETSGFGVPVRPIEEPLVTRVARPWLRVGKAVAPTHPAAPGDELVYTLTYENYGTDPAHNVIIEDTLPAQVDFVSCSGGDSCDVSGNDIVTWAIAEVDVATVDEVQVTVVVTNGTEGQVATNANYTIASDRLSTDETITGDPVSTEIRGPYLTVQKSVTPTLVQASGNPITYTITFTNDGGGLLTNIILTDAIDTRTQVVKTSLPAGCSVAGQAGVSEVVTCQLGDLAQAEAGQVMFKVYLSGGSPGDFITNVAYGRSDQTASEASNETEVIYTSGGCIPPYNLDFSVSANPRVGKGVVFTASALGDTPMQFTWLFGDGLYDPGQVVTHTYTASDTYTVRLTVTGCGVSRIKEKQVVVLAEPDIALDATHFGQSAAFGTSTILNDQLTVSNAGTWPLNWSIEVAPTTWLSVSVDSGPSTIHLPGLHLAAGADADVTLFYNPADLAVGDHHANLVIASDDPDEPEITVPVTLTITGEPDIAVTSIPDPREVVVGSSDILTAVLTVSNEGATQLDWSAEVTPTGWLSMSVDGSPAAVAIADLHTAPGNAAEVTLFYDPSGLSVATYQTNLVITSNDPDEATFTAPITLSIISACVPVTGTQFTYVPARPQAGQPVTFTGSVVSGTTPINYTWNFGGEVVVQSNVYARVTQQIYTFTNNLDYTVILTTTNMCDTDTFSDVVSIGATGYEIYLPLVVKNSQ